MDKIHAPSVKDTITDHTMSERKNLKIAADTYEDLREEKRDMETWDAMFRRLLAEREN